MMNATQVLMNEALQLRNKISAGEKVVLLLRRRDTLNKEKGLDGVPESQINNVLNALDTLKTQYDEKMETIEALEDCEQILLEDCVDDELKVAI
ncbi:MAG: hypothetical protein QM500_16800 [Methylococcales bacterium]